MKTRTFYKLLEERAGRYYSWSPPYGCTQRYFINRINHPKIPGSGMFVFDTLESATEFYKYSSRRRAIFECVATGVRKRKFRMKVGSHISEVELFWKNWRKICPYEKTKVEKTFSLCDTLQLVKRVV